MIYFNHFKVLYIANLNFMPSILSKVQEILSHQFSLNETSILPETKLDLELGADSRDVLELMANFEVIFDIEIAYEDVVEIVTVNDIVKYIENKKEMRKELYKKLI
jgi:acyl carrier protein